MFKSTVHSIRDAGNGINAALTNGMSLKIKFLVLIYFILNSLAVEAFDSCRSIFTPGVPPLTEQLKGTALSIDHWANYSAFIKENGVGDHPHIRMTNYFESIAGQVPHPAKGRLYRGMALSQFELEFILREGLLLEKTKGLQKEIFASTEMASPIYYALSRITEQNNLAVIVVIKPMEQIEFQANTHGPYVKTDSNIPRQAIERVFVFDPEKRNTPFPFRELILP